MIIFHEPATRGRRRSLQTAEILEVRRPARSSRSIVATRLSSSRTAHVGQPELFSCRLLSVLRAVRLLRNNLGSTTETPPIFAVYSHAMLFLAAFTTPSTSATIELLETTSRAACTLGVTFGSVNESAMWVETKNVTLNDDFTRVQYENDDIKKENAKLTDRVEELRRRLNAIRKLAGQPPSV